VFPFATTTTQVGWLIAVVTVDIYHLSQVFLILDWCILFLFISYFSGLSILKCLNCSLHRMPGLSIKDDVFDVRRR
jgi:hypothetical protein